MDNNKSSEIKMEKLTEKTLLPISLVLTLSGGIAWLTTLHNLAAATSESVKKVEEKQDKYSSDVQAIREDLAVIKDQLKRLVKRGD